MEKLECPKCFKWFWFYYGNHLNMCDSGKEDIVNCPKCNHKNKLRKFNVEVKQNV